MDENPGGTHLTGGLGVYGYNPAARLFQRIGKFLPLTLDYLLQCSEEELRAFGVLTRGLARNFVKHGYRGVRSQLVDKQDIGPMLMWLAHAEPDHQRSLAQLFDGLLDATGADEEAAAYRMVGMCNRGSDWSTRVNHNTSVYQYRLCYRMPLYCTGAPSRSVTLCRPIRAGCTSLPHGAGRAGLHRAYQGRVGRQPRAAQSCRAGALGQE